MPPRVGSLREPPRAGRCRRDPGRGLFRRGLRVRGRHSSTCPWSSPKRDIRDEFVRIAGADAPIVTTDEVTEEAGYLGALELLDAEVGERVLALGGRRQRALLALLALEPGRVISVDVLADELWNGDPPPGAATTLRSYASRLRRALGPDAVLARGHGYALETAAERLDVKELRVGTVPFLSSVPRWEARLHARFWERILAA
jgi:hypothetical protein